MIRQALTADAPDIVALWNYFIRNTSVTFNSSEKTREDVEMLIQERGPGFLVADDNGTLAGFATVFQFRGGVGYAHTGEHTVILSPELQGRGHGRALMEALFDVARGQGLHSLFAGVSAENPDGRAFHAALGFSEVARLPEVGRKFGRWMDLILMQRFL
ncbi:GNAT family N-acetyltransferase [Rhodalgimonas zhirmunskyi]|uniref:GNAT family N-acetyltransferase n=1 Tax=Rhodalgimonas zhirmunskyi TaxID=2964767 RepID=A0AAJ1U374_9RHOB|nr:N-acetyltransferase family protein [Rhodoalgimonas zhirmunskyi]MDQ2092881.1 GNAT family N-acetyltransferase [Rhodoalgimonas zhirmunskyi]